MKLPALLTVELNCPFPNYACHVTDNRGTVNGGFLKRFRTHAAMYAWLEKHGYAFQAGGVQVMRAKYLTFAIKHIQSARHCRDEGWEGLAEWHMNAALRFRRYAKTFTTEVSK